MWSLESLRVLPHYFCPLTVHDHREHGEESPAVSRLHGDVGHSDSSHHHFAPASESPRRPRRHLSIERGQTTRSTTFSSLLRRTCPGCRTAAWSSSSSSSSSFPVDLVHSSRPITLTPPCFSSTCILSLNKPPCSLFCAWTLSGSNSSSSRGNIYPVVQISCIRRRLHPQLDGPVHSGDDLPRLSGQHVVSFECLSENDL